MVSIQGRQITALRQNGASDQEVISKLSSCQKQLDEWAENGVPKDLQKVFSNLNDILTDDGAAFLMGGLCQETPELKDEIASALISADKGVEDMKSRFARHGGDLSDGELSSDEAKTLLTNVFAYITTEISAKKAAGGAGRKSLEKNRKETSLQTGDRFGENSYLQLIDEEWGYEKPLLKYQDVKGNEMIYTLDVKDSELQELKEMVQLMYDQIELREQF